MNDGIIGTACVGIAHHGFRLRTPPWSARSRFRQVFHGEKLQFRVQKDHMDSSVYRRTSASWRRFPDRYPLCRPAPVSYIQLSSFLFPLVLFDFDALKHCVIIARKYRNVEKKISNLPIEREERKPGIGQNAKGKGTGTCADVKNIPRGAL